jgi:hypothetical protein
MFDTARVVSISTSSAPHLMLLFLCSPFHILRAMLVGHASHFVILNLSTISASTLGNIHFITTLNAILIVLAFIHRQTSSMMRWDANEQRSTRVLDVNARIIDISY